MIWVIIDGMSASSDNVSLLSAKGTTATKLTRKALID